MTTVPPEIRSVRLLALTPLSKHSKAPPDPLPVGKVITIRGIHDQP